MRAAPTSSTWNDGVSAGVSVSVPIRRPRPASGTALTCVLLNGGIDGNELCAWSRGRPDRWSFDCDYAATYVSARPRLTERCRLPRCSSRDDDRRRRRRPPVLVRIIPIPRFPLPVFPLSIPRPPRPTCPSSLSQLTFDCPILVRRAATASSARARRCFLCNSSFSLCIS